MKSPDTLGESGSRRLAHAKELHADADAAHERGAACKRMAQKARDTAEQLRSEGAKVATKSFSRLP